MSYDGELNGVRAILESQLKGPSVLLVSGATVNDDSAFLADAIVNTFRTGGGTAGLIRISGGLESVSAANLRAPSVNASRSELQAILESWRANYDLVVVDASPFLENRFAPRIAAMADGVILALSKGRPIVPADRRTAQLLSNTGTRVFGIVTLSRRKKKSVSEPTQMRETDVAKREGSPLFSRS